MWFSYHTVVESLSCLSNTNLLQHFFLILFFFSLEESKETFVHRLSDAQVCLAAADF